MNNELIKIDGTTGEGGGQILRTAIALAAVTQKPCHIFNIRSGREKPGLSTQHLFGLEALARLCDGRVEGDFLTSREIKFWPGKIKSKDLHLKIETAGSITLVLQSLIPPALFAGAPVKIVFSGGGTDTFFSPTIDHFRYVFLKIIEKMGAKVEINISRRGYYPEGKAWVGAQIFPLLRQACLPARQGSGGQAQKLKKLNLTERGKLQRILAISGASESLSEKMVAEKQMAGVREILGKLKLPVEEKIEYYSTASPGSQICLIAEFENTVIGADNIGKLGKRSEDVGKEAANELLKEAKSEACLDKYLADQILPYLALAKGESQVSVSEITKHAKTNIWVIERFIKGKFEVKDNLISWKPEA